MMDEGWEDRLIALLRERGPRMVATPTPGHASSWPVVAVTGALALAGAVLVWQAAGGLGEWGP